jgi:hypothetical protein
MKKKTKAQKKIGTVMREFKKGKLKSSSGQKVTNPKQAIAISLSEAGMSKKEEGQVAFGGVAEKRQILHLTVRFSQIWDRPAPLLFL